jgi:nucleoside phosphorylase
MEASAFIHTCLHLNITSLGIIKGVSDQGDKKKGEREDEIYPRALEMTAEAIQKWVQYYNPSLQQIQQSSSYH